MFGTEPRPRRPALLLLVLAIFLVLVGITASAQAAMVSTHFSTAALNAVVGSDAATVRTFVSANSALIAGDLDPAGSPTVEQTAQLEAALAALVRPGEIVAAELRRPDGTIIAADRPGLAGTPAVRSPAFDEALAGAASAAILATPEAELTSGRPGTSSLLQEYLPLVGPGDRVEAVVAIWRDAVPVLAELDQVRRDVVTTTLGAAIVAAVVLFLVFRAAQGRLTRQTEELVESSRTDALTGLLNHGTLVGLLAGRIEAARAAELTFGVALLDLDGFRLLNELHGHEAGDDALLAVVRLLDEHAPVGSVVGRYGPDEFLVVSPMQGFGALEPSIDAIRTALADLSLQFASTERLPITLSAGIAGFPLHGASVTTLLSSLAHTLETAKASGGDDVRVAGDEPEPTGHATTFGVLQGLVFAVDTKDRYTKRHSEDVARYALFLARRLGLDEATLETIRIAGLLHDVGKIGIPDSILRKPGRLTADEQAIVQQHVALGDLIVRDLPDLDRVRAAVRHHHERWDGAGYLDHLAGEEIPLVARILAVGDSFSAMTTTRPYRKALEVGEALRRLGDAAGTQFDEQLVSLFIEGMESATDAPLPAIGRRRPGMAVAGRVA